ncbi:hypothetical protein [Paenibacillus sp. alder61]|nr:hypothetical protein [Paenibacillus sp. alder61]
MASVRRSDRAWLHTVSAATATLGGDWQGLAHLGRSLPIPAEG